MLGRSCCGIAVGVHEDVLDGDDDDGGDEAVNDHDDGGAGENDASVNGYGDADIDDDGDDDDGGDKRVLMLMKM